MLRNLKAEMVRANVTVIDLAKYLNVTEKTIRNKIDGTTGFSFYESLKIRNQFFPKIGLEFLFVDDSNQDAS